MTWAVLMLAVTVLVLRLVQVQGFQASDLRRQAQAQQTASLQTLTPRRPIVDRQGQVLAMDELVYTLYAHPPLFHAALAHLASVLAPLLNRSELELSTQLQQPETTLTLASTLSESQAKRIAALQLAGLELVPKWRRRYPNGEVAATALGYVDLDHQAQAGLELSQAALLQLPAPQIQARQTGQGLLESASLPAGFSRIDTSQLQLSLDLNWQRLTQNLLHQTVTQYAAKRGCVIVMDPLTGEIRVLASEPTYNPNHYYDAAVEQFKTWAATDLFEPGSTFKPINLAIALEAGAIQPSDQVEDSGRMTVAGEPIENFDYATAGAVGPSSLTDVLRRSSNVGMVRIMQRLKPETYYSWLRWIGLEQPTGVDLPLETTGQLKPAEEFLNSGLEPAVAAFGQGLELSPLKLIQLAAAVANGGWLIRPHLVTGLRRADGPTHWQPEEPPARQIFSPTSTQAVMAMMKAVVEQGTGQSARLPGYSLAGKTGTAQKATADGQYGTAPIVSFVGLLPIEAPCLAILVVVDEPQGDDASGSTVAAPLAKAVLEQILAVQGIAPAPPSNAAPTPTAPKPTAASAPEASPNAPNSDTTRADEISADEISADETGAESQF
ncbi:penicillin-binding protein 2 [Leptolyngbya sp. FACHB-261]|uniref:peptidoglycan D,D-transpeptidase FtsI family protein n=1 Tax=Leptolyngbya sp. FACHB-261 TaxID=2692806 RepID=UPI001684E816|nr:penicillin-binding protein 2 [Leptolyngbya sp. FACHB-261]MBD2101064.1 penicillin-binding protein 2 [Leptolyngbya sp. FACHB-261]